MQGSFCPSELLARLGFFLKRGKLKHKLLVSICVLAGEKNAF
jgi:hypothetical protein